ncbi:hypothetical protein KC953_00795, partial [Candidatus Saccharibacteria bacterium]|nr:hypothetical protein [Candidatus Saccharibacteria bacterium]
IKLTISTPSDVTSFDISASDKDGNESNIVSIGNFAIINRNVALLTVSSKDLQTSQNISPLPWFEIKKIALHLEHDLNADKISGNHLGCSAYNKKTKEFSTFSCGNPFGLYQYKTSSKDDIPWNNKQILNFPQAYNAAAFHNGVLGIANNTSPWLFYADINTKKVSQVRLPVANMSRTSISSISVVPDSTNPNLTNFLLVDNSTGIMWFGMQNGLDVTYRKYEHKISDTQTQYLASMCKLVSTKAYCYFGNTSASPDSEGETIRYELSQDGVVDIIDFSTKYPTAQKFTISKDTPLDDIYADKNGQLYGRTESTLYSLQQNDTSLEKTVFAKNIGAVSGGESLYYIKNNKLFQYDSSTKTTTMRFVSKNLRLSNINLFDKTVLFTAYIKGSNSTTLHAYKLLDTANTNSDKRLLDIIPTSLPANESNIIDIDYSKSIIHVVLPNYVEYRAGKIVPSIGIYNSQKSVVRNYLSNIVPSFSSYKVTFSRIDS